MIGELLVLAGALLILSSASAWCASATCSRGCTPWPRRRPPGVVVVLLGAAIHLDHPNDVTSLVLAAVLQLVTSPVAANMISTATYRAEGIAVEVDTVDELEAQTEEGAE